MQDGKINLRALLPEEIAAELKAMGQPAYRAKQVFEWATRGVSGWDEMTNLPKQLRTALAERFYLGAPKVMRKQVSAEDGTIKYLWGLRDGNRGDALSLWEQRVHIHSGGLPPGLRFLRLDHRRARAQLGRGRDA